MKNPVLSTNFTFRVYLSYTCLEELGEYAETKSIAF